MKLTLDDFFDLWDTIPEMASDVGVPAERAKKWLQRGRIPDRHWPAAMVAAARKGKKLSADDLLVMHAKRRGGSAARAGR